MARLIDADTAYKVLTDYYHHNTDVQHIALTLALNKVPTVEAEPVRHGKWIDMADFEQCSSCSGTRLKEMQTVYGKAIWIKTPYCPNCGARMDEATQ